MRYPRRVGRQTPRAHGPLASLLNDLPWAVVETGRAEAAGPAGAEGRAGARERVKGAPAAQVPAVAGAAAQAPALGARSRSLRSW
jgi:hypothetical protein